jgi:hypothetical protein
MALYLDALEDVVRKELETLTYPPGPFGEDPRTRQRQLRHLDLTRALESVGAAREELERCPAGAELAFRVLSAVLARVQTPAELADLHYKAARKGAGAATQKRRRRAVRGHAKILRDAAKLNPSLNTSAKAKLLARTHSLSESRIRHILSK